MRNDIHRPSAINPEEYELIAMMTVRELDMESVMALATERQAFVNHMEATGAKFSQHKQRDGAGMCQICGAWCVDYAIFYHIPNNEYIKTGFDCAAKLEIGDERAFRDFRKARKKAEELKSGKLKAESELEHHNLQQAWTMYESFSDRYNIAQSIEGLDDQGVKQVISAYETARDVVSKLVKYGQISEKQYSLLHKLVDQVNNAADYAQARQQKREQSEDVPTGKVAIEGTIVSAKVKDTPFGAQTKMLVEDDRGFKVFGTVPSTIKNQFAFNEDGIRYYDHEGMKGQRVAFTANVQQSRDDSQFGFFSRPSKAKVL